MDLKESAILGDSASRHWYYKSKAAALRRYIRDVKAYSILDIGAGSGFFTKHLLEHTDAATGLCVDTGYVSDSDECCCGKPLLFRRSCETVEADLVLLMDVLEHVSDDRGLLAAYIERVPKGTHFLITVPAFQRLWSDHDVFLEHFRRYDIRQIEAVVSSAGLRVKRSSYYFALVFPIAGALRLLRSLRPGSKRAPRSELKQHSHMVNEALAVICQAELPILHLNRLGGLSVFCLASKI